MGIPDFRTGTAPDVDYAEDERIARSLAATETSASFAAMLDAFTRMRPAVSAGAQRSQAAHFEAEREQAETALDRLGEGAAYLDLGCGAGRYLQAATGRFATVVGVDASLAQLVLARKLLREGGVEATLAAAEVERLPFADATFDAVTATDLIEHLADPEAAVSEAGRVTSEGGRLFLTAPNRYSLTPEPHVGVWGLGFLPRERAEALVARRFGIDYRHIRPPSLERFRTILSCFPGEVRVETPAPGPREIATFGAGKRLAARAYLWLRGSRALGGLVERVAPYFQGWGVKR